MIYRVNEKTFFTEFDMFSKFSNKLIPFSVLKLMLKKMNCTLTKDSNVDLMFLENDQKKFEFPDNANILYTLEDINLDCNRNDIWKPETSKLSLKEKQNIKVRFNKPKRWFNVKKYNVIINQFYAYCHDNFNKFFNDSLNINLIDTRRDNILCFWEIYYTILLSIQLTVEIIDDEYEKLLEI